MQGMDVHVFTQPIETYADLNARNELFVTAGANKSLSFYREASGI